MASATRGFLSPRREGRTDGAREVTFTFDAPNDRELPLVLGQLMVLPRHWWTGTDAHGRKRNISETTLEPPLGSGPYRIKSFEPSRTIIYGRIADYWGRDLPVNVGSFNLDELRFDYFRDFDVEFEAFKAGAIDWRTENTAKNWATGYDFPAVLDKQVLREEFQIRNMGVMQAFAFNLRRRQISRRAGAAGVQFCLQLSRRSTASFSTINTNASPATSRGRIWPRAGCRMSRSSRSCNRCARRFHPKPSPPLLEPG